MFRQSQVDIICSPAKAGQMGFDLCAYVGRKTSVLVKLELKVRNQSFRSFSRLKVLTNTLPPNMQLGPNWCSGCIWSPSFQWLLQLEFGNDLAKCTFVEVNCKLANVQSRPIRIHSLNRIMHSLESFGQHRGRPISLITRVSTYL